MLNGIKSITEKHEKLKIYLTYKMYNFLVKFLFYLSIYMYLLNIHLLSTYMCLALSQVGNTKFKNIETLSLKAHNPWKKQACNETIKCRGEYLLVTFALMHDNYYSKQCPGLPIASYLSARRQIWKLRTHLYKLLQKFEITVPSKHMISFLVIDLYCMLQNVKP